MSELKYLRHTPCGDIAGTDCQWSGVAAYKGIRYATAARWCYPEPVTHWDGVYEATEYGACCYQPRAFYDESQVAEKAFYYNEFRRGETYRYSEDCLFLNIWAPADAAPDSKLPVIFYIHGGGFTGGCGHEKHFDGPEWPTKGCVAVTINYRLGPLAFACLDELAKEAGHTGNYGLFDQLCALQWVRANIGAFGGDADNITVMGQSAGAMSVQQLCLTPLAEGLFAKAVMSSGGGVSKMLSAKPVEELYPFWENVMAKAGCADLAALRALAPETLFTAWQEAKKECKNAMTVSGPAQDGVFICKPGTEVVTAGEQRHIPYMLGMTSEDIMPPILYTMVKGWCKTQDEQNGPACFGWFFDRQLPGDKNGAWHSSDLWYWFGTLDHCWRPLTATDKVLSAQMVTYLTNFAKTGNPNGGGIPTWTPLDAAHTKVLRLGEQPPHMGKASLAKLVWTMLTNKAVGE